MGLEQRTVKEVVEGALKGTFNLPEFQRTFVWRPDQVRDLIDSLYRDYPVGSMLVWDASDYDVPQSAQGAQTLQWIVDGQQRTTALCIAFGLKPYWWDQQPKDGQGAAQAWNELIARIDVLANLDRNSDDIEFALANPVRRHDPNWFAVRRALRCVDEEAVTALALEVAQARGAVPGTEQFSATLSILLRLWRIRSREVPLISVQHELEDVAEIFSRLNRGGTHVTEADVIVALVAAYNPGWVRDEFVSYSRDWSESGFDLEPGVYIRTITGIAEGTARLKDVNGEFWRSTVKTVWPKAKEAINHTIRLLMDRGILSAELLPSRNSLIPLFVFQAKFGKHFNFNRLFYWFLLANADGRYSGSAVTSLTQDVSTINSAPDGESVLRELLSRLRVPRTVDAARFLEGYSRDRFGRLLLYLLLFQNGATDWVSEVRLGYTKGSNSASQGFLPEWHHIFPRAVLKKAGRSESDANLLANITVLNEATNRHKLRAKVPKQYIQEYDITPEEREQHYVPLSLDLSVDDYDEFVTERAERLAAAANEYLAQLSGRMAVGTGTGE